MGGLDPGGGAGLVQDRRSAAGLGATAVLIGTAWTDQSPRGVAAVEPRDPAALLGALRRALAGPPARTRAVKVGMVATSALADAIIEALDGFGGPVVFDPVLAASSGGSLFDGPPERLLPLARRAGLVTPNLREAAALAGLPAVADLDGMRHAAHTLRAAGVQAVLVKGGHLPGEAADLLLDQDGERLFASPRVPGPSPRGTGCALATAIAVELARGRALAAAIEAARSWLADRIRRGHAVGDEWHLGD